MNKEIGIYIHIPFCVSKCYYCDFISYTNQNNMIESYINALCKEILDNADILSEYKIKSIYFGGGTPSFIDSKYIVKIMNILSMFSINNVETTIEINPNSITLEKLSEYASCGINRLSIGLQSTFDDILKKIGRVHKYSDFLNTLKLAKQVGFTNISIDLIYPLPELTLENFKESVNTVISLKDEYNIKHISVYNLEIHENTKLKFLLDEGYISLCDEDTEYEMKNYLEDTLENNGYIKYEISNFAINDFYSRHNINYWRQGEYLGFGVCSSSFILGTRYKNTNNLSEYINNISSNKEVIEEKVHLDKLDLMKEYIILNLRLVNGVSITAFNKKFNTDIFNIFGTEIKKLKDLNLIYVDDVKKTIYLTKRGSEVANTVWQEFI